jgi:acyl dehydratase
MPRTIIRGLCFLQYYVGRPLGVTEWVTITQARIDTFAEATDDHQWVHCDVERARRESPWKTTIAHGYLTLSLVPSLLSKLLLVFGWKTAINTGIERMRLSAPVPAGSRVRLRAEIKDVRELPREGYRVTFGVRIEVEGARRPACTASVIYVYYP